MLYTTYTSADPPRRPRERIHVFSPHIMEPRAESGALFIRRRSKQVHSECAALPPAHRCHRRLHQRARGVAVHIHAILARQPVCAQPHYLLARYPPG